MEISFENKVVGTYREISHQLKRIQESMESVVPDTNDDIGRIASVQTSVLLKSKDLTGRGVSVTGEACACILYITEGENAVSFLRLSKNFSMDFDIGDMEPDITAQINLSVTGTEARILNPRKVSVTMELSGELSCYRPETIAVESLLPGDGCRGLHARIETAELMIANAVCEKTFAVNGQFSFPSGKPAPACLAFQGVDFSVNETEHIGSKLIIKGNVNLAVCYLSEEVNYPLRAEFSTPFSQIIDTGEEEIDGCSAMIALNSAYYEIIDTINGEKALDAELHAVLQIVSHRKRSLSYISDAYSNLMPAKCVCQSGQINCGSGMLRSRLTGEERLNVGEDCADVLSVFTNAAQVSAGQGGISAAVTLDFIYRSKSGALSAARRLISLEGQGPENPASIIGSRICELNIRPDGATADCRLVLELCYLSGSRLEINRVVGVTLDEEAAYDQARFPSITLAHAGEESLWEIAKNYHSSTALIRAVNAEIEPGPGRLLLIPREI